MLLNNETLDSIKTKQISIVFRIWKRPTVKKGGTLTTRRGVLYIDDIERIDLANVKQVDLKRAGLASIDEIGLGNREGDLYKITLHYQGEDPRIALRDNVDPKKLEEVYRKLTKMGDWTKTFLKLIGQYPNTHSQILADKVSLEKNQFKRKVRRLKSLGLTKSLRPGYRLSKRGEAILRMIKNEESA